MKIGSMNNPLRDIAKEIQRIGESGFDFIDLTYELPKNETYDPDEVKQLIKEYKFDVVGHTSPSLPAIFPLQEIRQACMEELKKAADFFSKIGASKMNVHPFYYAPHLTNLEKVDANIALLKELSGYCQSKNIDLMMENYIVPFNFPSFFQRAIEEIPELKVHLDVAHCNINHDAIELVQEFFEKFGDRITHIHMHDNHGASDEHLPIGCGNIDWKKIIQILKKFNYDDTITLEVFSKDFKYLLVSRDIIKTLWSK